MAELTLEKIESDMRDRVTTIHKSAQLLDKGDQWQNGDMFIPFGYMNSLERAESQARIKLAYSSENVCTKVINNEQNGLLGREPDFSVVLVDEVSDAEQKRLDGIKEIIEKALVEYWNEAKAIQTMRKDFRLAATQEIAVERAFVPSGYIDGSKNIVRQSDLVSAMKILQFQVLTAEKAGVFKDTEFYKDYGVFIKEVDGIKRVEICYVDSQGRTRIRIIRQSNGQADASQTLPTLVNYIPNDRTTVQEANPQDLGGQILMFEINRPPLITESIISNQKNVNLGHTMQARGTYQNGHRDAFALNAQPPTEETIIKNQDGTTSTVEVPTQIVLGGGSTNFLNGAPVYKKDTSGNAELVGYANASIQIVEPIDPQNFIKTIDSETAAIYRQCCQEHLYANQDVSGVSKEVSRAPFEKQLVNLKPTFDAYGRWKLTLLLYFGVANSNSGISIDDLKKFRIDFNCIVDAGAPSSEIIKTAQDDVKEGNLSVETYLSKYRGLEDADAEIARLEGSEVYKLSLLKKRLDIINAGSSILTIEDQVKILHPELDETQIAEYVTKISTENAVFNAAVEEKQNVEA